MEFHTIIEEILNSASLGCNMEQLTKTLGLEIPLEEKHDFIAELIKEKILINEFEYGILSKGIIERMICRLKLLAGSGEEKFLSLITKYKDIINELQRTELGKYPQEEISELKNSFSEAGVAEISQLFQIDLKKNNFYVDFAENDINILLESIEFISRLGNNAKGYDYDLIEKFKKAFLRDMTMKSCA